MISHGKTRIEKGKLSIRDASVSKSKLTLTSYFSMGDEEEPSSFSTVVPCYGVSVEPDGWESAGRD